MMRNSTPQYCSYFGTFCSENVLFLHASLKYKHFKLLSSFFLWLGEYKPEVSQNNEISLSDISYIALVYCLFSLISSLYYPHHNIHTNYIDWLKNENTSQLKYNCMSKVGQIHQEEPSYKGQFTIACRQYTLYKSKRKKTKKNA